jgi:hypothetical protein
MPTKAIRSWSARLRTYIAALVLLTSAMALSVGVGMSPAQAVGPYNNAAIADYALTFVGQNLGPVNGQCRMFVNNVVSHVSGGTQNVSSTNGGYFQAFLNAGGIEITDYNALTKGDVVQKYVDENDLHTWIIVSREGDYYWVVDSNSQWDETVRHYKRTWFTGLSSTTRAFRMGSVGPGGGTSSDVAGNPAAITRSAATMDVFYRNTSGHLVNKGWDASSGWATQSWTDSTVVGDPVAVPRGVDDMDVFYRGTNGSLVNRGWNVVSGWGNPTVLVSGGVAGVPAVVSRSATSMDLFWRTDSGALKNMWWNASSGWSGVQTLVSSGITGDPIAIARTSTSLDIFVRKGNGYLANLFWSPANGWQYQDWSSSMSGGRPTAVSRYASSTDVFFRKSGSLGNRYWNSTSGWHYQEWSAGIANSPTAVARSSSNIDVFFRATSGDLVVRYWSASQGWGGPATITSGVSGLVAAVARGTNDMDVFFRTTTGELKNAGWNSSQGWYHVTSL